MSMIDKSIFRKSPEELQDYLQLFRRRGSKIYPKKGRGSKYDRNKEKRKQYDES